MINLQKNNQVQRERRKEQRNCRTPDEQGESSANRKADYARRKNTLCAESIAMPRPDLASALSNFHTFNPHAHCPTLTLSALTQQFDSEQIDHAPTVNAAGEGRQLGFCSLSCGLSGRAMIQLGPGWTGEASTCTWPV